MNAAMDRIEIEALPKQWDFLRLDARECLYSGAYGAGKSLAVCLKLVYRASRPGAREGLCRKHLVWLKATTLRTLLRGDGETPPALPHGYYTHHKADKIISIRGGGEIVYFGIDDPESPGSLNLTGCAVDQAEELDDERWSQLRGRMRVPLAGLPAQLYGACNPSAPSHHLALRFGLVPGASACSGCAAVQTRTVDNRHLPPEYIADLATLTGVRRKRYFEGLWAGAENLIYEQWDRGRHVALPPARWKPARVVCGVDYGVRNPFCCLRGELDGDGVLYITREEYRAGMTPARQARATASLSAGAEAVAIDPSAAGLIAECSAIGLPAVQARNEVIGGIDRVRHRLETDRLFVSPDCVNLIREFESYEMRKDREEPVKEHDHAMDALRYLVAYLDAGVSVSFAVAAPGRPERDAESVGEPETVHSIMHRLREDPDYGWG